MEWQTTVELNRINLRLLADSVNGPIITIEAYIINIIPVLEKEGNFIRWLIRVA